MEASSTVTDRELIIRRVIGAPRALVFEAFADPHHISAWWGPEGFSTTTEKMELKVGGQWRFTMHGPDGTDYANVITYTEIARPERLCYDHGEPAGTAPFKVEVTFEDLQNNTGVTLRMMCDSAAQLENMKQFGAVEGGKQTLERLERYFSPKE